MIDSKRAFRSLAFRGRTIFTFPATPGILAWTPFRPLLPVAAALAAFGGSLWGSFHFDDYSLLANPLITSVPGLWRMWGLKETRPLTNLTFWLNYHIGGTSPPGYHAINLVLHVAVVILLFFCLRQLIPPNTAFWAALLMAVHPIQSETVAYIFARSSLLSTALCLGCLHFYLRTRWIAAVSCFALALLAKEECVTFPLLLLFLPATKNLRVVGCMLGLAAVAGLRAMWATSQIAGSGAGFTAGIGPLHYLSYQGAAVLRYLRLIVVPWGFTIEPDITAAYPALYGLAWAAVLALAVTAWFLRKRYLGAIWIVSGLILLIPSSTIFPAADLAADRRMYLPMIAFSAVFGLLAPQLWRLTPAVIIAACISLSIFRMEVWRTEQNLWREAVQRSPQHVRPFLQLSRAVGDDEAAELLVHAKHLEPNNAAISAELGRQWLKVGRYSFALQEFGRALALQPNNANALNNRGAALLGLKQREAAKQDFERALKSDPCVLAARRNLMLLGVTDLPKCPTSTAK